MNLKEGLAVCMVVVLVTSFFSLGVASCTRADEESDSKEYKECELELKIDGGGIVTYDPDAIDIKDPEADGEWIFIYEEGTEVTFYADPYEDWEFVEWKDDIKGTERNITFEIEEDMEVTAVFEKGEDEDVDTPGFTLASMLLAVTISIVIFHRKRPR
ncbi:MAG: hypothetical protein R6W73_04815 [Candidatus Saliniplasma sp.]